MLIRSTNSLLHSFRNSSFIQKINVHFLLVLYMNSRLVWSLYGIIHQATCCGATGDVTLSKEKRRSSTIHDHVIRVTSREAQNEARATTHMVWRYCWCIQDNVVPLSWRHSVANVMHCQVTLWITVEGQMRASRQLFLTVHKVLEWP